MAKTCKWFMSYSGTAIPLKTQRYKISMPKPQIEILWFYPITMDFCCYIMIISKEMETLKYSPSLVFELKWYNRLINNTVGRNEFGITDQHGVCIISGREWALMWPLHIPHCCYIPCSRSYSFHISNLWCKMNFGKKNVSVLCLPWRVLCIILQMWDKICGIYNGRTSR